MSPEAGNPSSPTKRGWYYIRGHKILCLKGENDPPGSRLTEGQWSPLGEKGPGYLASAFSLKPSATGGDKMFLTRVLRRADLHTEWFYGEPKMITRPIRHVFTGRLKQNLAEKSSLAINDWIQLKHDLKKKAKKKRSYIRAWQRISKRESEVKKRSCGLRQIENLESQQSTGTGNGQEVERTIKHL